MWGNKVEIGRRQRGNRANMQQFGKYEAQNQAWGTMEKISKMYIAESWGNMGET